GATSFSPNSIITSNANGTALIATSSNLTVTTLNATSTIGTSTFAGAIGVGTTTPGNIVDIYSAANGRGLSVSGPSGATIKLINQSSSASARNWMIANNYSQQGTLEFVESLTNSADPFNGGSSRVTFASGGAVGINTQTPQSKLDVGGNAV